MPVSLTPNTLIHESVKNTSYSNLNKPTAKKTNNQSVQLLKTAAKGTTGAETSEEVSQRAWGQTTGKLGSSGISSSLCCPCGKKTT